MDAAICLACAHLSKKGTVCKMGLFSCHCSHQVVTEENWERWVLCAQTSVNKAPDSTDACCRSKTAITAVYNAKKDKEKL